MLVWCPDWPVIAAGIVDGAPAAGPVAVVGDNRVIACSPSARAAGVRRNLRKRDAQARCPELVVVPDDPARDARAFEPVVAAVEEVVAGVAVVRPGVCAFTARGPARYFGTEEAAAERVVEQIAVECAVEAQIGVADGTFAALLAARLGRHVPAGRTAAFLAELPVSALERPALVGLLDRLGVRTLGAFAALNPADVLARFGLDGALAHRLAAGKDDRPLAVRSPPPDLEVEERPEEPIERVDVAAFAARALAERLHEKLAAYGLACTRLAITAVTADGRELHREWRHDGILTATAIADRTRWQLDGWLSTRVYGSRDRRRLAVGEESQLSNKNKPAGGIVLLRLAPEGVLAQVGLQPGLWGEAGAERDRAHRAMHRVQGLLGPEAVLRGVLGGGADPARRATLVPWGEEYVPASPDGPWPDRLLSPFPVLLPAPVAVEVTDLAGVPVAVSGRLALSGIPALVSGVPILAWTGPFPLDERWWDVRRGRARVRFQVVLGDGRQLLLEHHRATWSAVADFD
ncbi:Y-family DNA polymerase [Hamadaea tsunoensis]|uniref:Y-family DNA polymerase n=1 Tax=Hamadaea tsunoensis TaxID=53368 RepID=UPI000416E282|nr:DNA polymerase Y family protein [Hamadaea tsunoensis]